MYKAIRNSIFAVLVLGVAGLFSSCVSPKEVVYLQGIETSSATPIKQNYEVTIQKDDQLYISVSSKQPELVAPFAQAEIGQQSSGGSSSQRPQGYLVNAKGDIVLPIIGKIKAAGKTCTKLGDDIAAALYGYEVGDDVEIIISRNGRYYQVELELIEATN